MSLDDLPRARFAHLPTPLEEAPRLAQAIGVKQLWIKREDLDGLAFGGNKTRLMEFVIGDALENDVDTLIAAASPQSNKLRDIAAAGARFGLRSILLIPAEAGHDVLEGNRLLFDLFGAEVRAIPPGTEVLDAQRAVQRDLEKQGRKSAVLDRRLDYGALATAAYVAAAHELAAQWQEMRIEPDYVVVTAGAGMTMAGLVLGFAAADPGVKVIGIANARSADGLTADIEEYCQRTARRLALDPAMAPFEVIDGFVGPGYGVVTEDIRQSIRLVARQHGLVLDPVYNGKTMTGLIEFVRAGRIEADANLVYMHTGGSPAIFAYSKELEVNDLS